jgi:RsiW-degrading membrane proteinase PrsW (M82 family)
VPTVNCPCGLNFESTASAAGCPKCGTLPAAPTLPAVVEVKIRFFCGCGAKLTATARFVGRTIECPGCGQAAAVPAEGAVPDGPRPATTRRQPSATTVRRPPSRPDGWRSLARFSMLLGIIPLAIFTFVSRDDLKERREESRRQYPDVAKKFRTPQLYPEEVAAYPSHRIEGAAFSIHTSVHWAIALLTALIFWEFILIIQPMGNSTSRQLWAVGIFTGTIGILMLIIVTLVGALSAVLNIPVLKYLGYSYGAAMDPSNGFVASMIGFTVGVGFLEELCKALPLYWHYRKSATLDARGAVVWGLATGIGFGVSEGISYSGNFYNGISGGGIYVVRFISCVSLHAVWSATVAILIWRRQERIHHLDKFYQWFPIIFSTLASSMLIHGFYDTCLKKEYGVAALGSAILSFAVFFWLYDRACRQERSPRSAVTV